MGKEPNDLDQDEFEDMYPVPTFESMNEFWEKSDKDYLEQKEEEARESNKRTV